MSSLGTRPRLVALALSAMIACGSLAACSGEASDPGAGPNGPTGPTSSRPATSEPETGPSTGPDSTGPTGSGDVAELTLGVYGNADETAGFETLLRRYNSVTDSAEVTLERWSDRETAEAALRAGDIPDVFLVNRLDLGFLLEGELVQPVNQMLDARGVDFGDDYSRDSLRAFSVDSALQCMPYGISPMVVYYNRDLIDFPTMDRRGLDAPLPDDDGVMPRNWSFEQFTAAAEFGTRPRMGARGVSIEPSLEGLTPFILSGGGHLFDDEAAPTSLALSDDDTVDALETALPVLRDGAVNLTPTQLDRRSRLEWFKRGKVAMIAGYRNLVPQLRRVQTLNFDVMPIPVIDQTGTVGDVTGLCLSAGSEDASAAADLLTYLISEDAVTTVTREGALVPANTEVAGTDDFLQDGRQPRNSRAFTQSVRDIYVPPVFERWRRLEGAVQPGLEELFGRTLLDRDGIEELTTAIDEASAEILLPTTTSPETEQE